MEKIIVGEKMVKCPNCNSTRFKEGPKGKCCLKCGFRNDPNYLGKVKK